jgi:hypothetical protein
VVDPGDRLIVDPGSRVSRKSLLSAVPEDMQPLARKVWGRRAELNEWLEADPERGERFVADPVGTFRDALPNLDIPDTVPSEELQRLVTRLAGLKRRPPQLEEVDPEATEALRLLGRLLERVEAGTTTPAQIAADPVAAVRAVADTSTPAGAITRLADAIRFVLGGPYTIERVEAGGLARLGPHALEALARRGRPSRPN